MSNNLWLGLIEVLINIYSGYYFEDGDNESLSELIPDPTDILRWHDKGKVEALRLEEKVRDIIHVVRDSITQNEKDGVELDRAFKNMS